LVLVTEFQLSDSAELKHFTEIFLFLRQKKLSKTHIEQSKITHTQNLKLILPFLQHQPFRNYFTTISNSLEILSQFGKVSLIQGIVL